MEAEAHPAYRTQPQLEIETDPWKNPKYFLLCYGLAKEGMRQLLDCKPVGSSGYIPPDPSASDLKAAHRRLRQWMQKLQQQHPGRVWPGGLAAAAADAAITHQQQQKPIGRVTCKFMLRGKCRYGNTCRFSHEWPSDDEALPCIHFSYRGSCRYGRKCRYMHDQ